MSSSSKLLFISTLLFSSVTAFVPQHSRFLKASRLYSTPVEKKIPIIISGDKLELTAPLSEYATKKLENVVDRHREYVTKCEVHMTVTHNPSVKKSHKATATVGVKGNVLRDSVESDSMYAAIDEMADGLARKLRKFKERRSNKGHAAHGVSPIRSAGLQEEEADLDEEDDDDDEEEGNNDDLAFFQAEAEAYAIEITKVKSFSMDPMTAEEAALCLDYIDHPFYVFRNQDTGDVNVLYRRNSGGLGLIEPAAGSA